MTKPRKPRAPTTGKIDPEEPANIVIGKLGGLAVVCQHGGYPSSTVWGWMKRGDIPPRRVPELKELGLRLKPRVVLKDGDFLRKAAS